MNPDKLYAAIVQVNNTEMQAYWARYNIQSALNTAVLGLYIVNACRFPHALPIAGIVLSIFWLLLTWLGDAPLDLWLRTLRTLERIDWPDGVPQPFTERRAARHRFIRPLAKLLPVLFTGVWLAALGRAGGCP